MNMTSLAHCFSPDRMPSSTFVRAGDIGNKSDRVHG